MRDHMEALEGVEVKFSCFKGIVDSRASLTVKFTVKSGDPPGAGKIWENRFFTGKIDQKTPKKRQKVGGHMPRFTGNLSKQIFVHYWRRRSHFSAGFVQIVLKGVYKDFSQAAISYFSPSHFPKYSSTTSAGWLWNIVTVKEWHFSAGVVQTVLKQVHKDFSQAGFSYFWPLHFPNDSSTTSAGWLWYMYLFEIII